jgi:hypothetical protein
MVMLLPLLLLLLPQGMLYILHSSCTVEEGSVVSCIMQHMLTSYIIITFSKPSSVLGGSLSTSWRGSGCSLLISHASATYIRPAPSP